MSRPVSIFLTHEQTQYIEDMAGYLTAKQICANTGLTRHTVEKCISRMRKATGYTLHRWHYHKMLGDNAMTYCEILMLQEHYHKSTPKDIALLLPHRPYKWIIQAANKLGLKCAVWSKRGPKPATKKVVVCEKKPIVKPVIMKQKPIPTKVVVPVKPKRIRKMVERLPSKDRVKALPEQIKKDRVWIRIGKIEKMVKTENLHQYTDYTIIDRK